MSSRYDHEWLARMREAGWTWEQLADNARATPKQLYQAHSKWRKRQNSTVPSGESGTTEARDASVPEESGTRGLVTPPSLLSPAPFDVGYPNIPPPRPGGDGVLTAVLYGDTHGQFIDPEAEAVLLAVLQDFKPRIVVHVGDAVDCYNISRFDKDPLRKESFQEEIDAARAHLARARASAPDASFYLFEGNHEERLRKAVWQSVGAMREVSKLREFQETITWPRLLQLGDLGIEWVSAEDQPRADIFPKFIVKHGTSVNKWSGVTARNEWLRYGKSGASGHVHRLGMFWHRDWNGGHVWVETGCLCGINPLYMRDPDWQQGFIVASFHRSTGAYQIEPVYVHKGRAVWRGNIYHA